MKQHLKWVLAVLVLFALGGAVALLGAWRFLETPMDPSSNSTAIFTIETGSPCDP